jgi:hypothetical protein
MHRRWNLKKKCPATIIAVFAWLISHQTAVLFYQNKPATSHQQPANSTLLLKQTSTTHQPPAKLTGCILLETEKVHAILNFRGGYMKFFLKKHEVL